MKAKRTFELRSYIPGVTSDAFGVSGRLLFCNLGEAQPLLLSLDKLRVRCSDLLGKPCGFVTTEHNIEVADRLENGEMLLARTDGPCMCIFRDIIIWSEGERLKSEERAASFKAVAGERIRKGDLVRIVKAR